MDMSFSEWMGALGQVALVVAVSFVVLCLLTSFVRYKMTTELALETEELGLPQEREFRQHVLSRINEARRARTPLTIALLHIPEAGASTTETVDFLRPLVRSTDVVLSCGENRVGLLLVCGSEKVDAAIKRIAQQAVDAGVKGESQWRFGVAGYPDHGYKTSEIYPRAVLMIDEAVKYNELIAGMSLPESVKEEAASSASLLDPLTGLIREEKVLGVMRRFIAQERRQDHAASMVVFDVDQPERLLDQYGKPTMDLMIKELAQFLDANIREVDILGRFGSAGFVCAVSASPSAMKLAAQRIQFAVRKYAFKAGNGMKVSLCAGVAGYPDVIGSVAQYFVAAEAALHAAKALGRNQCVKYDRTLPIHNEGGNAVDQL